MARPVKHTPEDHEAFGGSGVGHPLAGWSSSVAHRAHNPKVAGSNPAPASRVSRRAGPDLTITQPWVARAAGRPSAAGRPAKSARHISGGAEAASHGVTREPPGYLHFTGGYPGIQGRRTRAPCPHTTGPRHRTAPSWLSVALARPGLPRAGLFYFNAPGNP